MSFQGRGRKSIDSPEHTQTRQDPCSVIDPDEWKPQPPGEVTQEEMVQEDGGAGALLRREGQVEAPGPLESLAHFRQVGMSIDRVEDEAGETAVGRRRGPGDDIGQVAEEQKSQAGPGEPRSFPAVHVHPRF